MKQTILSITGLFIASYVLLLLTGCSLHPAQEKTEQPQVVSVITIDTTSITTYSNFPGSLEGVTNIEIRPQVEGYLEKIYIDEGAYVKAGQPLFLINDKPFNEELNNANAVIQIAKANAQKAQIEVTRLQKLVAGKVISQVQLDNAKAILDAENANVSKAEAAQKGAAINKGFTLIKAPVNGYIGRIPYKIGSLVGHNEPLPLTQLSDIHEMYAYFSMSEQDFLQFKQHYPGNTIEEKIKNIPEVTLLLPDNSAYPEKGKVETIQGQFDKTTAAITFRAAFPNTSGLLRSGNTGTIVMAQENRGIIQVPQAATFELQNKVMVFAIGKDNRLINMPLKVVGKDDTNYIISNGLKPGDRIVSKGMQRLHEDMLVSTK
ncbi:efflux RND transporter periplasmic adaptor subunit [Chitinophaga sp. 30R24]|uniref:efflux RND transporter periplasmic adaptor subunit n=1 Tax=Chitinophaga sp. 30R24 TaxID=3248838 RepID=UPI003B910234